MPLLPRRPLPIPIHFVVYLTYIPGISRSLLSPSVFAGSAPEVLARESVDEKVDMWALGVVMWGLLADTIGKAG